MAAQTALKPKQAIAFFFVFLFFLLPCPHGTGYATIHVTLKYTAFVPLAVELIDKDKSVPIVQ